MTTTPDELCFEEQLTAVLASEDPHPIEVATLGGLLARVELRQPGLADQGLLKIARAFVDNSETIDQHIFDLMIDDAARSIFDAGTEAEQLEHLLELDELCAACWYADCPERAVPTVMLAVRFIHSEPESWLWLAPSATEMLANTGRATAPARDDPAYNLWAAIESTAFYARRK